MVDYSTEFHFVKFVLEKMGLSVNILDTGVLVHFEGPSKGVLHLAYSNEYIERYFARVFSNYERKVLYKQNQIFLCSYYSFLLPGSKKLICLIGPFTEKVISEAEIRHFMEGHTIAEEEYATLINFFSSVPRIEESALLRTLLSSLVSHMWNDVEIRVEEYADFDRETQELAKTRPEEESDTSRTLQDMMLLQKRYDAENELLAAISRGDVRAAERLSTQFESMQTAENRAADPVRNIKNYTIIFNTLFRKAIEQGKVHPIHINKLSSQMAYKIEECRTTEDLMQLRKEMIRKYCLMVRNHSMSNFTPTVQKVLTVINNDLTQDLSLSSLAAALNLNASYLSTQFKQEMGQTITDYVTEKRIQHAILLLNSTDMQIAAIATACGISDVQYFSKVFHKRIGHTPSEYRKMIK